MMPASEARTPISLRTVKGSILRMAQNIKVHTLLVAPRIVALPTAVIVVEYVDVARAFFGDEEPKLVNAVLDRVSRRTRGEGKGSDPAEK